MAAREEPAQLQLQLKEGVQLRRMTGRIRMRREEKKRRMMTETEA